MRILKTLGAAFGATCTFSFDPNYEFNDHQIPIGGT